MLKRSLLMAAAAALALTGCSGGETKPAPKKEASAKPAKKGKKGKRKPAADAPHANPWAKDAPAGAAPEQAAKAPVKKKGKKKMPEPEHVNPWAKDAPDAASEG